MSCPFVQFPKITNHFKRFDVIVIHEFRALSNKLENSVHASIGYNSHDQRFRNFQINDVNYVEYKNLEALTITLKGEKDGTLT